MPSLKQFWQFEKTASRRAWDRVWGYLPFTPKQAGFGLAAFVLTGVILVYLQGFKSLIDNWGGLAGLIGTAVLICIALALYLYEHAMASADLYYEVERERDDLRSRIAELQTTRLRLEFREDDTRYLARERAGTSQFQNVIQVSIHNDSARTIDDVVLTVDDVLPTRAQGTLGGLGFRSDTCRPRTLLPGDHIFIKVIECLDGMHFTVMFRPTHNRGWDPLRGDEFLIKIRVGGRDVPPARMILRLQAREGGCSVSAVRED